MAETQATLSVAAAPSSAAEPSSLAAAAAATCPSHQPFSSPNPSPDHFLPSLLASHPSLFKNLLENAEAMRLQILVSEVGKDRRGRPCLVQHGFRVDAEYFYPASTVKLCAAVALLQQLSAVADESAAPPLSVSCPLSLLPLFEGQQQQSRDESNLNGGFISVTHEIRKLFLVSDNEAFNRLLSLVGHRQLNEAMWHLGLTSVRIRHRLSVELSEDENRLSQPISIQHASNSCSLPPKRSSLLLPASAHLPRVQVGEAYLDSSGHKVPHPMDFSQKNRVSLLDLQLLLAKIMRPDIELPGPALYLDEGLRRLLLTAMLQYPAQSRNPKYSGREFTDDYCKFALPGVCKVMPKDAVHLYNKIGQAYGFTTENCYVQNIETGLEFFFSMTLYTNENQVLNDDIYEYDDAYRLIADVAEVVTEALVERHKSGVNDGVESSHLIASDVSVTMQEDAREQASTEDLTANDESGTAQREQFFREPNAVQDLLHSGGRHQLLPQYKFFIDS